MVELRQSTAVVVSFGPAVLNSDAVTYVVNLVGAGSNQTENTSTGIRISKNGGALAARHAAATASTYDAFGMYSVTLDTTDTGTLGVLRATYGNAAAFCPIWQDFMVITAVEWDRKYATSGGNLPNAVAGAIGGVLTAPTTANVGLADLSRILGSALTETAGLLAGGFKKLFNVAGPTGTLNSLPDAVPGAAGGLLVDDVWTDARAAKLDNLDATITSRLASAGYTAPDNAGIAAIKLKTDNLPSDPADASDILNATNALASAIAGVQSDTDNIQTRLPAALTGAGNMKSDALAVDGSTNAATNLKRGTLGTTLFTCDAGGTTTAIIASSLDPASAVNDQWNGKIMTFDRATTTAALRGQSTPVTDYVHATLTFTVTALTTAPVSGDTGTIS